jgi:predicted nucleic acid-binding protein
MAGIAFDSTYLIDLFNPKIAGKQRAALDHLVQGLSKSRTRILIPSPCLTELLVRAGKARDEYVQKLGNSSTFEIISFDRRAATECALLLAEVWDSKTKRGITLTKFKYDWMIVACAASRGVKEIYSDDEDIARCAAQVNIQTIAQKDLNAPQGSLPLPFAEPD